MKKSIFTVAMSLCLLVGTNAFARMQHNRGQRGPVSIEQRANMKTERLQQQLGLSDEQAVKVYAVQLEQMRQQQALRRQMQALRQAEAEQMKAVLSAEQFELWMQSQQQRGGYGGRPEMRQGTPKKEADRKADKAGKSGQRKGNKSGK